MPSTLVPAYSRASQLPEPREPRGQWGPAVPPSRRPPDSSSSDQTNSSEPLATWLPRAWKVLRFLIRKDVEEKEKYVCGCYRSDLHHGP